MLKHAIAGSGHIAHPVASRAEPGPPAPVLTAITGQMAALSEIHDELGTMIGALSERLLGDEPLGADAQPDRYPPAPGMLNEIRWRADNHLHQARELHQRLGALLRAL